MSEKLCVVCQQFDIDTGHPGWSEDTPGWETRIRCLKQYWKMDNYETTTGQFRVFNRKAETCADYTPVRED